MKYSLLFFLLSLNLKSIYCQEIPLPPSNNLLVIGLGSIRHENETVSQNGRIKGLPTFDYSASISMYHFFENKNTALSISLQLNSFKNAFDVDDRDDPGFEGFDAAYSSIANGNGYFKLILNYLYYIKLSSKIKLGAFIGPALLIQRNNSLYDWRTSYSYETVNNQVIFTSLTSYECYKIKKYTMAAQFGLDINYNFSKKFKLFLTMGYTYGFTNFNRTDVISEANNSFVDKGSIYSKGNGLSATFRYFLSA